MSGALSALNGPMDRSDVTDARSLAGEEQFVLHRIREDSLVVQSIHRHVRIRATRERIVAPVMNIRSFELGFKFTAREIENRCQ